jgi:septal ring factor EnvC (AmiA/AmiB activator)
MKNPQDATRRNIQAANKKIAKLSERVKKLEAEQRRQKKDLASLMK